jgi:endonuclease/exonuclease/phosphatase family metal-dependent hydrolase
MSDPNELKRKFTEYIQENLTQTQNADVRSFNPESEFRIATYNIHYFTNVDEKASYEGILDDIRDINAHVIGLQEFILGNRVSINADAIVDTTHFYDDVNEQEYSKSIMCNSVPSWFQAMYGNIALIKDSICDETICSRLDETIHTFDKSLEITEVSGLHSGTAETRCFVYFSVEYNRHKLHFYITHLDVAREANRLKQIRHIVSTINRRHKGGNDVAFIMGDFNTFNVDDMKTRTDDMATTWTEADHTRENGKVVEYLIGKGFHDCHARNPAIMTTWNTTRVDFIFCNRPIQGDFRAEYFYTLNSDHIPVLLTLTHGTRFLSSKSMKSIKSRRMAGGIRLTRFPPLTSYSLRSLRIRSRNLYCLQRSESSKSYRCASRFLRRRKRTLRKPK